MYNKKQKQGENLKMSKKALIIATSGVEDTELISPLDVLTRQGIDVDIAFGTSDKFITTTFNLQIIVKKTLREVIPYLSDYDALYIPGGVGHKKLDLLPETDIIIKHFIDENKVVGALCAGPTLLAKRGYLRDVKSICHTNKALLSIMIENGAIIENHDCKDGDECEIVIDKRFITGLKMETSIRFSYALSKLILR